jgi:hypothetical protein
LARAYGLVQGFRRILRGRKAEDIDRWIVQAGSSEFPSFRRLARTLTADLPAVRVGGRAGMEHWQSRRPHNPS